MRFTRSQAHQSASSNTTSPPIQPPVAHTTKLSLMSRLRGDRTTATHDATTTSSTSTAGPPQRERNIQHSSAHTHDNAPIVDDTTAAAPLTHHHHHHHHQRKPSVGDKISGAVLKLKGSIFGRTGEKAAGSRRMKGTDGKGTTKRFY